jgi:hypothetical protein
MKPIVTDPAPAVTGFDLDVRINRLATATARQQREALLFLSGYAPAVFVAVLDSIEAHGEDESGASQEAEPFCGFCGEHIGVFQRTGPYWMHYRGGQPGRSVPGRRPRPWPGCDLAPSSSRRGRAVAAGERGGSPARLAAPRCWRRRSSWNVLRNCFRVPAGTRLDAQQQHAHDVAWSSPSGLAGGNGRRSRPGRARGGRWWDDRQSRPTKLTGSVSGGGGCGKNAWRAR